MASVLNAIILDIETTATEDPEAIARVSDKVRPPVGVVGQEAIAKWDAEDRPAAVASAIQDTALSPTFGSIVTIAYGFIVNGEDLPVSVTTMTDEGHALECLMSLRPVAGNRPPVIVGHNHVDFDMPFIRARCAVHGIKLAPWFPIDPKPWSLDVFDTMKAWSGIRGRSSLVDVAWALGVEVTPTIPGKDVPQAIAEGRYSDVMAHCAEDVRVCREIFRRMMAVIP